MGTSLRAEFLFGLKPKYRPIFWGFIEWIIIHKINDHRVKELNMHILSKSNNVCRNEWFKCTTFGWITEQFIVIFWLPSSVVPTNTGIEICESSFDLFNYTTILNGKLLILIKCETFWNIYLITPIKWIQCDLWTFLFQLGKLKAVYFVFKMKKNEI